MGSHPSLLHRHSSFIQHTFYTVHPSCLWPSSQPHTSHIESYYSLHQPVLLYVLELRSFDVQKFITVVQLPYNWWCFSLDDLSCGEGGVNMMRSGCCCGEERNSLSISCFLFLSLVFFLFACTMYFMCRHFVIFLSILDGV